MYFFTLSTENKYVKYQESFITENMKVFFLSLSQIINILQTRTSCRYSTQIFKFKKREMEGSTLSAKVHSPSKECFSFHSEGLHWKSRKTTCEMHQMAGTVCTDGITESFRFIISKEK